MNTIADMLGQSVPIADLGSEALEILAAHARLEQYRRGDRILRTGNPADTLYVIEHGLVALEVPSPRGSLVIETLEAGDLLGISWMLPPHRLTFDARCVDPCGVVGIDAAALREACDEDPTLGFAVYKLLGGVLRERLQATRVRLLDLYGGAHD